MPSPLQRLRASPVQVGSYYSPPVTGNDSAHTRCSTVVIRFRRMGRLLVRLVDESGFTLAGERVENAAQLELQLEGDQWIGGSLHWSANTGNAVVFVVKLGGPHERHATEAPEVHLRLDPTEAYFRFPTSAGN